MKIVTVMPLKKGVFNGDLTYFTSQEMDSGDVVEIPIRNKKILGLVASVQDASSMKSDIKNMQFNLKKVIEKKKNSIFRKEFWDSVFIVNKYFAQAGAGVIPSLIPSILRDEYDKVANFKNETETFVNQTNNAKAEKLLFQAPTEERISYYKTLIRGSFAQKKSVFVILPTEHSIDIFHQSLSKGIENFSFLMHGGLSPKKNLEKIEKMLGCDHPVLIIGTAPFLAIPRKDLGTIILENESSSAYKTLSRPYFDLRIFVEVFAAKTGTRLILADTLLRFETINRKESEGLSLVRSMSFKVNFDGDIHIEGESDGNKKLPEIRNGFKIFTTENTHKIRETLSKGKNIFVFALRKGLATMTICRDCGETVMCDNCLSPVVLYSSRDGKKRMFICNRCSTEKDPNTICSRCGSWNLMPFGIGTETVLSELKEILENSEEKVKIFRLDKESARNAKEAEKIIEEFENSHRAILVGTEMALFYLKEKVHTSIIASFDSLWSIPNFKMGEKIIQLLISIISRTSENLIIQTKNLRNKAILAIQRDDLISFIREELRDRLTLGYPPYVRFIKITHLGEKEDVAQVKTMLEEMFAEYNPDIFSGFVSKLKNKYVTNALIKVETTKWSTPELLYASSVDEKLLSKIKSLPREFEVSVDPEDLL